MTSTVPTAVQHADEQQPPITMFGPDFPYAYDDFLNHPAGLGQIPATEHGTEVAVIGGGLSGIVAAYELMKMGLKPVVYEADQIGGRLRTVGFDAVMVAQSHGKARYRMLDERELLAYWPGARPSIDEL